MEYTDRHFRHLVRLVSSKTLLYTEMVAANALSHERRAREEDYLMLHPDADTPQVRANYSDQYLRRYLSQGRVEPLEGASVLQLGGSDPKQMFEAAETVLDMTERGLCDYTAINLNCGCPSPKVAGKGCFGAALMDDAALVADLTQALHDGCGGTMPITVKCRIGTDSQEAFTQAGYAALDPDLEYRRLCDFIERVASNGIVTDFSVHARIAVLQKSYSPSDNRKIPPLKYDIIRRLVNDYPEFTFTMNGGVESLSQAQAEFAACPNLAGVMIGRSLAADPWSFAMADQLLYGVDVPSSSPSSSPPSNKNRLQVLEEFCKHADSEEELGDPVKIRRFITKAVTTLFTGEPNGKRYRIALDEVAGIPKKLNTLGKTLEGQPPISELIMNVAYEHLSEEVLLRTPEESYERKLDAERKRQEGGSNERSEAVAEWQTRRKEEEAAASA
jgi:tRNA-dihydrouridine synthase A